MNFIKLLLFFISNLGYIIYLNKKTNINKYYLPFLVIAFEIVIIFIAGLLNILSFTTFALYILGLSLFIKNIIKDKVEIDFSYIFLFLLTIFLYFILKDRLFEHYDNFSHWALIVKTMLSSNHLPTLLDKAIEYPGYPPASGLYVYYFSKMVGNTEGIQMVGQDYIILSCLLPILKYIKNNKLSYIFYLIIINFIFTLNIGVDSLLVDTLLSCLGFVNILFIYDNIDNKYFSIFEGLILSTIILTKNSGLYFVIISIVFILYLMKKKGYLKNYKYYITMSIPFISLWLWKAHCSYVFDKYLDYYKHAFSFNYFLYMFGGKSDNEITNIFNKVIDYIIQSKALLAIILYILIIGIFIYLINKKGIKKYLKVNFILLLSYIAYVIGLIAMYIFSMPRVEADMLAGIERYIMTSYIFIYLIITIYAFKLINMNYKGKYALTIILIISIFGISYINNSKIKSIWNFGNYNNEFISITNIYHSDKYNKDKSYIIYVDDIDSGYIGYFARYRLYPATVSIATPDNISKYKLNEYDYLINLSSIDIKNVDIEIIK